MTNADNCCCSNAENGVLVAIVQQDEAISMRLGQVAQAFGGQAGSVPGSNVKCSSERSDLWAAMLVQRQAIFDQLQQVILAV